MKKAILIVGYIGLIWLANAMTVRWGFVTVFGISATAGTIAAGLVLGVRDALSEVTSRWVVVGAILVGAGLSYFIAPALAAASGVAFLFSELADLTIYEALRKRSWTLGVVLSNIVGAVIDTVLFLGIAFGVASLTADSVTGQLIGKALMVLPALPIVYWARARRSK